ncbi:MAG: ferredoxin-type protein NapH [Clostridium sp.]|jgi:ferredoxin-type protein NapH
MRHVATIVRLIFLGIFIYLIISGEMMLWLVIFAISLIVGVFFGRVYCGYVCPMNTLMIPTEWVSKKLHIQVTLAPKWLESGKIAWLLLIVSVGTMIISKKIFSINLPILAIFLILSILITLRYEPYVFHNKICPFGVLQSLTGKYAKFSRKVNTDKCIGCRKCEEVCPSQAIVVSKTNKKASINKVLCHQCFNCQSVCPKDAIQYIKILHK